MFEKILKHENDYNKQNKFQKEDNFVLIIQNVI